MAFQEYPRQAGWKEGDTSKSAAEAIEGSGRARTLRSAVKYTLLTQQNMCQWINAEFAGAGMTADEIAAELGESPFSIRPRITELRKQGLIEPTGERRKSSNGRMSHVWRLVRGD